MSRRALREDVDEIARQHANLLRDLAAEREVVDGRIEIGYSNLADRLDILSAALHAIEQRLQDVEAVTETRTTPPPGRWA